MPHTSAVLSAAPTPSFSISSSLRRLALSLILAGTFLPLAHASVFITHPYAGIICHGGSACSLTWADDGEAPLLAAIGPCDFGLYQGDDTLVQQLATGLDVSQSRELSFTPVPGAGPNSDSYWIKLTAVSTRNPNDTLQLYTSFSGFFTLDGMSGTAGSPIGSLTSSLPLPASSASSVASGSTARTITTNGVVSTTTLSGVVPSGSDFSTSTLVSGVSAPSSSLGSTPSTSASSIGSESATSSSSASTSATSSSGARRLVGVLGMETNAAFGVVAGLSSLGALLLGAAVF